MNTYIYRGVFLFLLSGTFLAGCRFQPKETAENDIQFDSIQVDRTYHLFENPDNPDCNLQIKFTYPVQFSDKEILKKLQEHFVFSYFGENYGNLTPAEAVTGYTDDYIASYKKLEADFKAETERDDGQSASAWFSYYEMSSDEITYNRNGLLCYTVYFENYTGGAHGAHSFSNHVLNLKTGDAVTEEEIFIDDYQDKLARILVDRIAEQNKVEEAKDLENIGFFSVDEITPNGNFRVDGTGITYTFNEYEIAAYAVGITHVLLPYDEIRYLLRPDSPISPLTGN